MFWKANMASQPCPCPPGSVPEPFLGSESALGPSSPAEPAGKSAQARLPSPGLEEVGQREGCSGVELEGCHTRADVARGQRAAPEHLQGCQSPGQSPACPTPGPGHAWKPALLRLEAAVEEPSPVPARPRPTGHLPLRPHSLSSTQPPQPGLVASNRPLLGGWAQPGQIPWKAALGFWRLLQALGSWNQTRGRQGPASAATSASSIFSELESRNPGRAGTPKAGLAPTSPSLRGRAQGWARPRSQRLRRARTSRP